MKSNSKVSAWTRLKSAGAAVVLAGAYVATSAAPFMNAAHVSAYSVDPNASYDKVYVCKYVSTPENKERLQTGQNPISVSKNAIKDFKGIGSYFNDAQGRSYVVAWDNGDKVEPPVTMCAGVVAIPEAPAVNDPCGLANATWAVPADTDQLDWTLAADGVLSVSAKGDFFFADNTTTKSYGLAVDSNVLCPIEPPTPRECTVSNLTYNSVWQYDGYTNPDAGAWPEGGVSGTYTFMVDGLYLTTPQEESYVSGLVSAGETKLTDIDAMSYKTLLLGSSTGNDQILPGYILYVDLDGNIATENDQTYLFFEPIYNGTVQTGTWQVWDVIGDGATKWWSFDLTDGNPTLTWDGIVAEYPNSVALSYGFNQGTYNQGANTAVQDMVFDCATLHFTGAPGGQGGGEVLGDNTTAPVVTPAPVVKTPATLENTGTNWVFPAAMGSALIVLALAVFAPAKKMARVVRDVQFVAPMTVW